MRALLAAFVLFVLIACGISGACYLSGMCAERAFVQGSDTPR